MAVNTYMMETYDNDDSCQGYTEWVVEDFCLLWWDNKPKVNLYYFRDAEYLSNNFFTAW